jgi:hypothetical protein
VTRHVRTLRARTQQEIFQTTTLQWPKKPKLTQDRAFGQQRQTWVCTNEPGYKISRCALPDFTLIYPKWAEKQPSYHRTLKAAQAAAETHRNQD